MTGLVLARDRPGTRAAVDRAPLLRWLIFTGVTVFAATLLWRYGLIGLMLCF